MKKAFKLIKKDKQTDARLGVLKTVHGLIKTPTFVPVGSQATVKGLTSSDLDEIGIDIFFVNTYLLYLRPGEEIIEKLGGIHRFANWPKPIISDSGGFQVFSLAKKENKVKIDYQGVTFTSHLDGSKHYFTPEKSIQIQQKLKTDIMVAFDQCPDYPSSYHQAWLANQRTHRWAKESLKTAQKNKDQLIFGVIQGSTFKDLREESAGFINDLPFDGLAIGGVAVGEDKKEMRQVLDWVTPILKNDKKYNYRPLHLLGVGEIDDIFAAVEKGIDMMDCVMPTRLGRMGYILTREGKDFKIDITKNEFSQDKSALDSQCHCYVCSNYSKAYLHHLFKAHELLAYRLATYHNLCFISNLFDKIKEAISKNKFIALKEEWLKKER